MEHSNARLDRVWQWIYHQLAEGDKVDRGHSLAATLLLLLSFLLGRGGWLEEKIFSKGIHKNKTRHLARMVKPEVHQQLTARGGFHYLNNLI